MINTEGDFTRLYISRKSVFKTYHDPKGPDSKVHGANMGPTWVLLAPGGPHVGLMNLAIRVVSAR